MRPLPREATASYLTRLAAAYHLSAAQLLDGLHITATGTPMGPPAAEIHLSNEAARRLSGFTRIPPAHLSRALARRPPPAAIGTADTAIARWQPVQPAMQPLPACTACTAHRCRHKTVPAWIHPAPNLPRALICTRHQQASSDPRQRTPPRHPLPARTHSCPPHHPPSTHGGLPELGIDDHHALVRPPPAPPPALAHPPAPAHHRQPPPPRRPGLPRPDLPEPDHLPRDPHPRHSPRPPAAVPPDPHPADRLPPRPGRPPPPAPPRTRRPRPALATPYHPLNHVPLPP
ncbi:TniQ family protein [Streptomyces sp. NBC_01352]|uniref:TniQ family protein n=1 Tax=Streptomyces sp. NBC_01352 TaxID=2903834 RepID=UPI002E31426D|nr:TniQ family protein [Streptomyces sp. NBC_01352]